ncbi:hypothetical protein B9Z55_007775 [Caenorhabditis nigoni]|uniref:Uncharacterized protein n=1 Tax=Caenorhabditis nigoni TaxID=1611254 RepID=A0A2G5VBA1_9PELO|nr:hypothetical protein B9Z55_007775 [Caenorhabditis nigoni]
MNNQPVLYDSLKTILYHMDANLRINMSQRIPSIRATERAVPLKMKCLSFSDTTVNINDVRYELNVYRDYPNGDFLRGAGDFDRFGFEIPFGSSPILPGDVSVRNEDAEFVETDTDEWEQYFQTLLIRSEIFLQLMSEMGSGVTPKWEDVWMPWMSDYVGITEERLQEMANHAREKLKPFHCRRHNLPRPFNCYIQFSVKKNGKAKPPQKLAYTRKLYEAVKQFNQILFANRPVIQVNQLVCHGNQVYRIPVGLKISANELKVRQSQIPSIATILDHVSTLRVFAWGNVENWWQHRLVQNVNELIIDNPPLAEQFALMIRTLGNKIIRFHDLRTLSTEQYCELIENWMSVKRETGAELWIGIDIKKRRKNVPKMMQTRMEVVRKDERCVRIRGENGTQIELCGKKSMDRRWAVKAKIIEN